MAKLKGGSYVAGSLTVEGVVLAESFSTLDGKTNIFGSTSMPLTAGKLAKVGFTGFDLVDSIITESAGLISIAGAVAATELYLYEDSSTSNFRLAFHVDSGLSADRTLTINVGDANRTLALGANFTVASYAVTLTGHSAGTSALTLPADTTTISALTSGHVLIASATNTISGEAALASTRGGTGLTSLPAFYMVYGSGNAAVSTVAPNTTTTPKALMMTGTGSAGAAPNWSTIPNSALVNSSITINGTAVSLGGSISVETGAALSAKASTLADGGGNGAAMTFTWEYIAGTPTYVFGGAAATAVKLYKPANFSVNYATSAGSASSATTAGTCTHSASRTDSASYPIVWASGSSSPLYSCAAVTITSNIGRITATSFSATSSRAAKTKIKPFEGSALDILLDTKICTFYYKSDVERKHLKAGFIAEDTHELLATVNHDSVDLGSAVGMLIKSVQELNAKIEAQKAEIARLKKPFWLRWFR